MSVKQARQVSNLLRKFAFAWNPPWSGGVAAMPAGELPSITLIGGMNVTLLSPGIEQLERLVQFANQENEKGDPLAAPDKFGDFDSDDDTDDVSADTDGAPIFIAYSHHDEKWRSLLANHLAVVAPERQRLFWDDTQIQAGEAWRPRLLAAIEAAKVAVFLVSAATLSSRFIMDEELPIVQRAVEKGRLSVTWILLEPCVWQETPLARFQALNDAKKPLSMLGRREAEAEISRLAERLVAAGEMRHSASGSPRTSPDTPIDVTALSEVPFAPDRSVPNGASIAFLAEFHGRTLLVSGDAHAKILADSIRNLLKRRGLTRLRVDACIVPRGGSARNMNRELLQLLDCDRYLISTDGSFYGHPHRETIARILTYGRDNPDRLLTLVFNYRTQITAVWDNAELKARYSYEAVYPSGEGGGITVQI